MPKLWNETIEAHRREVRETILDTAALLVGEQGVRAVTMSQIAERAGIARATLYKYFSDVEAILIAWHERQISHHFEHLVHIRDHAGDAAEQLRAVLGAYALIAYEHHGTELASVVHRGEHVNRAHHHLIELIRDLIIKAAEDGHVRDDIAADELASYCLHALRAADSLPSKGAVTRLITVIFDGLHPSA